MYTYSELISKTNSVLSEAVKYSDFPKVTKIIFKYMRKHLGRVHYYPVPEVVRSSEGSRVGIRFFGPGMKSFRINWKLGKLNRNASVESLDYWDGTRMPQPIPTSHIKFTSNPSLAKVLPFVKDFMQGNIGKGEGLYVGDTAQYAIAEQFEEVGLISEAKRSADPNEVKKTVDMMIKAFIAGKSISDQRKEGGANKYGSAWYVAQQVVRDVYPTYFARVPGEGKAIQISQFHAEKLDSAKIVKEIFSDRNASVSYSESKGTKEKDIGTPGITDKDIEDIEYEQVLEDIKTGVKLLISNATNSLWIGGRGGTGKTVTVKQTLDSLGLKEDDDYIVIKGSASPVGVYAVLFEYKDKIILFDDSDSALADQEARNLIKAATDTNKVRKLSWMKGGRNFVDPDSYEELEPEEQDSKLPKRFEFTGKVVFISNLSIDRLDPDGALRTRGYVMSVDPTNEEIYEFMIKIATNIELNVDYKLDKRKRLEVVELIRARKIPEKTANLRTLSRGLETRASIELTGGSRKEWEGFIKRFA